MHFSTLFTTLVAVSTVSALPLPMENAMKRSPSIISDTREKNYVTFAREVKSKRGSGSQDLTNKSKRMLKLRQVMQQINTALDPEKRDLDFRFVKREVQDEILGERQASIDASLVPEFGIQAGTNPDGTGNCEGANGAAIPCTCPPDRATFISDLAQNVAAGAAVNNSAVTGVTFPTDDSVASQLARFNAATITLQNLQGPGVGCPQAATTFGAQIQAVQAGGSAADAATQAAPAAAAAPATGSTDSSTDSAASSGSIDASLVPEFGVQAGQNPDGTGNCDGVNGVKIPCTCPPDRATFISDLAQNVAAGKAVNNPDVTGITFPTGSDKTSVLARLNTATVTLQNLNGAGVGCPQAATTFGAQVQAAQALAS